MRTSAIRGRLSSMVTGVFGGTTSLAAIALVALASIPGRSAPVGALPVAGFPRAPEASQVAIPQGPTFGQLIAAVNRQTQHTARLRGMSDLQPGAVRLVDVAELVASGNKQALENALGRNSDARAELRAVVADNAVLSPLLREHRLGPENVLALDIAANGAVWLFYSR